MGEESAGIQALPLLPGGGHNVVAVFAAEHPARAAAATVADAAREAELDVHSPHEGSTAELGEQLSRSAG